MRQVDFDYPNTCPKIDREINAAKSAIESFIRDILDEACPLLPAARARELADDYAGSLYSLLEPVFENTRSANEDMRNEADHQIRALKDEVTDLEAKVADLERQAA